MSLTKIFLTLYNPPLRSIMVSLKLAKKGIIFLIRPTPKMSTTNLGLKKVIKKTFFY